MEVVRTESHDHVILQYYKLTKDLPSFNVRPPIGQTIGTLPRLYNRPSRAAYYRISTWPLVTQSRGASATTAGKQKSAREPKKVAARLVPLESASCGIAMEVAKADSKTNWESLMNNINESIRDTQQQRMIGQYMIQKLKRDQSFTNISREQAMSNKVCLEKLIERYGTGLEGIVTKEREFERLIEAYQVFIRGDKKKIQKKLDKRSFRKSIKLEEPLPAIGDQRAGRSQVGCKIRQELRKEYGERVRQDLVNRTALKKVIPTAPGAAPKPMLVRVRRSVIVGQTDDLADDEVDLPPTPATTRDSEEIHQTEEEVGIEETESQLSMTYVPSENQSLAQLINEADDVGTVEIIEEAPEVTYDKDSVKSDDQETGQDAGQDDSCLVLEGDTGSNVLMVNSSTELELTQPTLSPKFEILETGKEEAVKEEAVKEEAVKEEAVKEEAVKEEAVKEEAVKEEAEVVKPAEEDELDYISETSEDVEIELVEQVQEDEADEDDDWVEMAATQLINEILENLDNQAPDDEGEPVARTKSIHFKSSPDIMYYDKTSPEAALACNIDDKVILAEDLTEAESELDNEAKPLYHKVLSNLEQDQRMKNEDSQEIERLARELTNSALRKADSPQPNPGPSTDSLITETARELTSTILNNVTSS